MDTLHHPGDSSSAAQSPTAESKVIDQNLHNVEALASDSTGSHTRVASWIQTQITTFDSSLLLLAVKSVPYFPILTLRGSLPLVVFLSMYQATPVAHHFGSQTYIVAIVASLSFAMDPRAKFLRNLFISLILYSIAAAVTCLGLWSARQAKLHTQSAGDSNLYNSSAAAVSAVFFFFNSFAINAFRAVFHLIPEN